MSPVKCLSSNNTRQIMKTFTLTLTEAELETIGAAMDDYRMYAEDEVAENDLIGGLPVLERVNSIDDKITAVFKNS